MKVIKKYNQHRRDLTIDVKCEHCGHTIIGMSAYDDRNYWDNVIPSMKCPKCKKVAETKEFIQTKYPDGFQV